MTGKLKEILEVRKEKKKKKNGACQKTPTLSSGLNSWTIEPAGSVSHVCSTFSNKKICFVFLPYVLFNQVTLTFWTFAWTEEDIYFHFHCQSAKEHKVPSPNA